VLAMLEWVAQQMMKKGKKGGQLCVPQVKSLIEIFFWSRSQENGHQAWDFISIHSQGTCHRSCKKDGN